MENFIFCAVRKVIRHCAFPWLVEISLKKIGSVTISSNSVVVHVMHLKHFYSSKLFTLPETHTYNQTALNRHTQAHTHKSPSLKKLLLFLATSIQSTAFLCILSFFASFKNFSQIKRHTHIKKF